jgi:2-oxoisovalerate dehydrogenase E2 component (dihydrolipoyl transacylase)
MQGLGVREGIPVVVAPSVATLFLGETFYELEQSADGLRSRLCANLVLSFDHRVINGLVASQFLQAVKRQVESIDRIIG